MKIREARLLLLVVALGLTLAFAVAPRTQGQRNKRHTCRQECASKYQECLDKEGADAAECEKAFEECRGECLGSRNKPESERAANANRVGVRVAEKAEAPDPDANANQNSNANQNANGNANANFDDGRSGSAGGTEGPPRAPVKRDDKPPATQR